MNDSVHVRLLSDISDKVIETQSVLTTEEDSLWEFGGWKESENPRKGKTNSEYQVLRTKRIVESRARSFSKLGRKLQPFKPALQPERPRNTHFLLFPMSHPALEPHISPTHPATTRQTSRPKPSPKQLSLRSMMTKQVRQVISITTATQPIHSAKNRPSLSDVRENRPSFPRITSRKVIRRAETRQERPSDQNPVLFL